MSVIILVVANGKLSNSNDSYYTDTTTEVICAATTKEKAIYEAKKWLWKKYNSLEEWYGSNRHIDPKYDYSVRGGSRYDYESYTIVFEEIELV